MTDAFEALHALLDNDTPVMPSASFATSLRDRLTQELARLDTPKETLVSVTPYLTVSDAAAAIDFYVAVLGAVEDHRLLDGDRIGHAEILIGGSRIALADEYAEYGIVGPNTLGGSPVAFTVEVADADATFARAIAAGATELRAPSDQFHGHRNAQFRDPWGHRWTVSTPIHDRYREEATAAGFDYVPGPGEEASPDRQVKHHDIGDVYYFTLPTPDLTRAQAFFGAVLGWQFEDPERGHVENISAPPGGLHEQTTYDLWFVVHDIEAAVAKVRELGGTSTDPVLYDSGWAAECTDDQGTRFCLSVPAAKYTR
jgi:uncharacterized glyoxalase superfamily protein PhnB